MTAIKLNLQSEKKNEYFRKQNKHFHETGKIKKNTVLRQTRT